MSAYIHIDVTQYGQIAYLARLSANGQCLDERAGFQSAQAAFAWAFDQTILWQSALSDWSDELPQVA